MRLVRLDLTRYGKFTGDQISFGDASPGHPDLHIVYGPNEAGKSTAFSAFLDLLFGIETRSRYGFLHPYASMRIGGALEIDGSVREFIRIKRPYNSLLDAGERPIAKGIILGELGGIDRDAYRNMFSLDDESLEAGGDSILASKGELGQLLFAASAGLAGLSKTLLELRSEADGFYKFRARGGELAGLKNRLSSLRQQRGEIDTLAPEYARLVERRDRALAQYSETIAERARVQSRMEEIRRHLSARPRLAELTELREELARLADLPEAPSYWVDDLRELQKTEIELATKLDAIKGEIEQLLEELQTLIVDEKALSLAENVDRLADLHARFVTAQKDLPERRLQLQEIERKISAILHALEQDDSDPGRLILGAPTTGVLRTLIEKR